MSGIQDCGVEPVAYKAGRDLQVGDKVSVWWMPKGSILLEVKPYIGRYQKEWPGVYIGHFQKTPSPGAPKIYAPMTVFPDQYFAIMP